MQIYDGEHLGTHLHIEACEFTGIDQAFKQIIEYLRTFEARYSRFIPNNWLDCINTSGGGTLDTPALEMLRVALQIAELSDGVFDPTITPDLLWIGYGAGRLHWIQNIEPGLWTRTHRQSYRDIALSNHNLILKNGACIEFGGVGKGYALEQITNMLSKSEKIIINFGGDIFIRGGATIALENPIDPTQAIGLITIEEWYFCGSSGVYRRIGAQHHLLDGQNGKTAKKSLASFVFASSGIWADALATAVFVLGAPKGIKLLKSLSTWRDKQISGGILDNNGKFWSTHNSTIELFTN